MTDDHESRIRQQVTNLLQLVAHEVVRRLREEQNSRTVKQESALTTDVAKKSSDRGPRP